ncbi:hypothetical protein [Arthrobacter sp. NPDC090010]
MGFGVLLGVGLALGVIGDDDVGEVTGVDAPGLGAAEVGDADGCA